MITGPLFSDKDPYYIEKINDDFVRIPCVFWKVVYYPNANGLNAAGFMMSHKQLLIQDGTVTYNRGVFSAPHMKKAAEDFFNDYDYRSVYQVKVEFIQEQTGLKFMLHNVSLPYQAGDKKEIIYKRIEVERKKAAGARRFASRQLDYRIDGITL